MLNRCHIFVRTETYTVVGSAFQIKNVTTDRYHNDNVNKQVMKDQALTII